MARIRTIKPEFWSSPGIEDLDPRWRLLFIAMWNWADDYGRGTAEPRELLGFAFPRDEEMTVGEFRRGLDGIRRVFGVKFYQVSKRPYYLIPSWEKHQKIDKRAKGSKYPDPEDGTPIDPLNGQVMATSAEDSEGYTEDSEGSAELSRNSGAGTGEQGNRGIGEQRLKDLAQTSGSSAHHFDAFWNAYPRKVGKQTARKKFDAAAKRTGSPEIVIAGAHRLANDPNLPEKNFIPYPSTWLERDGWEDEPLPARQTALRHTPGTRPEDWDHPPEPAPWEIPEYVEAEILTQPEIEP